MPGGRGQSRRDALRLLAGGAGLAALTMAPRPGRAAERWVVFSDENFPPYAFTEDGRLTGLDTEIVEAVLSDLGVTPDHRPVPWSRALVSLDEGVADMAYQLVGRPDRFVKYHMVGPFRSGVTVLAARADSSLDIQSVADLAGLTVGTVRGFSYLPDFDAATHFKRSPAASAELSLRKLAQGRVDLVIGDKAALAWVARKEGLGDRIRFMPKPLSEVPRYVAFPRDREDKARRFAAALERLKADGAVQAIIDRWQLLA